MPMHKERFRRPDKAEVGRRLTPVFEDFQLLSMEGVYEYPLHQHTRYEVILVESGPYRCRLNSAELVLVVGEALIIKPGDWHQDHLRDGQRHYVLHFRLESGLEGVSVPELFRDGVGPGEQVVRGVGGGRHAQLLRELGGEASGGAPYAGVVQDSLLEVLFWRLVRALPVGVLSGAFRQLPEREGRRERIATVFLRNMGANPTVVKLAGALGMSPRHLVNECRELFGESPARLLLSFKLRRADELLRHRGMRVREVSDELGFTNPFHFSRVYRRARGYAPSRLPDAAARS